jgi:Ala-tRNA(Pro) deacylase
MTMPSVFKSLLQLLEETQAHFRVVTHVLAGKSEEVALARGTEVGQGAKALVCEIVGDGAQTRWALAVLPADRKLDRHLLAQALGGSKAKLADAAVATELTGCEIGAIPPFSFNPSLQLVVDPQLLERFDTIAFNAGRLDASILLDSRDFLAIAKPSLVRMSAAA